MLFTKYIRFVKIRQKQTLDSCSSSKVMEESLIKKYQPETSSAFMDSHCEQLVHKPAHKTKQIKSLFMLRNASRSLRSLPSRLPHRHAPSAASIVVTSFIPRIRLTPAIRTHEKEYREERSEIVVNLISNSANE